MKRKLSKILGISLSIALITSLLVAAVPAYAISDAEVTLGLYQDVISKDDATYKITLELGKQLSTNATPVNQGIRIMFPDEYTITDGTLSGATIVAGPGWIDDDGTGANYTNATINSPVFSGNNSEKMIVITFGNGSYIGEQAEVRIEIPEGIKNPDSPDDYQLTIDTWNFTTDKKVESPVDTTVFSIVEPYIAPLPGIAMGYNKEGILMAQDHSIQTCIIAAGVGGKVEVGPGSYDEDVLANVAGQTIVATGAAGTVIITDVNNSGTGGTLTITAGEYIPDSKKGVTVDGITFTPNFIFPADELITVAASAEYTTITNCDITSGASAGIVYEASGNTHKISNSTITATGDDPQTAIVADAVVAVSDSTITVGAKGTAISSSAGGGPNTTTVKGTTITGSSGKGIEVTGGQVSIDKSTLQSLDTAICVDNAKLTLKNSVVDTCGAAKAGKGNAIDIDAGATVRMYNNTIQNTAELNWAINLAAGAEANIHFNNIINNAQALNGATGNCSHNWWGSAGGPAFGSVESPFTDIKPYLGSSVTEATVAVGNDYVVFGGLSSVSAETTVGVDAEIIDDSGNAKTADIIGVAKYSENPETAVPMIMGTGSILGYYDVYVDGVGNDNVRIKFYGAPSKYTKLYYSGGISGIWEMVPGTKVNTSAGFLYVTIGDEISGLIPGDLGGTAFALVEDKTAMYGPSIDPGHGSPTIGSYDVPIEPMFTWGKIDEDGIRAIRYEIALSEDPTFTIIEWSYNVDETFYKVDEPLRYSTTYYWRVRGVLGEPYQEARQWKTPSTPWTVGIFTTEDEPAPPPDPIVVQPTKPEVNVEIPPTKITIEPAEQAIPNYMLWIIVAVGAILVIALIVLIVRTRRVV
jgi:hypothetical protein